MKGFPYSCAAAASFGLESVVRSEIERLGITGTRVEDRRVLFSATAEQIARCNLCLRTADRVYLQAAEFPAADFDALFEGVRAAPWADLLVPSASVTVEASSNSSRLAAVPSIQSVSRKAIAEAFTTTETGPHYDVRVTLRHDVATVSLDTTGPGLHKRGYRRHAGEAPLRENLAAALVLLSRWDPSRPFADPVCGSGTLLIEAALLAANAAPGLGRRFAAEDWPTFPASAWKSERQHAEDARSRNVAVSITGSDIDMAMIQAAHANAEAAGVAGLIELRAAPVRTVTLAGDLGCVVCNPPYGERLGSARDACDLARELGQLRARYPRWSFFALSALEEFPRCFGERPSRNRKLYNGNLRCWLYQYFGPLP